MTRACSNPPPSGAILPRFICWCQKELTEASGIVLLELFHVVILEPRSPGGQRRSVAVRTVFFPCSVLRPTGSGRGGDGVPPKRKSLVRSAAGCRRDRRPARIWPHVGAVPFLLSSPSWRGAGPVLPEERRDRSPAGRQRGSRPHQSRRAGLTSSESWGEVRRRGEGGGELDMKRRRDRSSGSDR